jgi:hypothetical protein
MRILPCLSDSIKGILQALIHNVRFANFFAGFRRQDLQPPQFREIPGGIDQPINQPRRQNLLSFFFVIESGLIPDNILLGAYLARAKHEAPLTPKGHELNHFLHLEDLGDRASLASSAQLCRTREISRGAPTY